MLTNSILNIHSLHMVSLNQCYSQKCIGGQVKHLIWMTNSFCLPLFVSSPTYKYSICPAHNFINVIQMRYSLNAIGQLIHCLYVILIFVLIKTFVGIVFLIFSSFFVKLKLLSIFAGNVYIYLYIYLGLISLQCFGQ